VTHTTAIISHPTQGTADLTFAPEGDIAFAGAKDPVHADAPHEPVSSTLAFAYPEVGTAIAASPSPTTQSLRALTQLFVDHQFRVAPQASQPRILKAASTEADAQEDVKRLFKEQFGAKAADKEGFHAFMRQIYGDKYDKDLAEQYRQRALAGDYGWLPDVKFVDAETLGGANGAYNAQEGVVYINEDLAAADPHKAAQTFVEEAGHHLDANLNTADTQGDEGEMFRRVLSGEKLTEAQIDEIRRDDDRGTITVDGKQVAVEFWNPFKAVRDAARWVGHAGASAAQAVGKGFVSVGRGWIGGFAELGKGWIGLIKDVATGAGESVSGFLFNLFRGRVGEAFSSVVRGFDRAIFQSTERFFTGVLNGMQSAIDGVTGALGPLGKPLRWVTDRAFDISHTAFDTLWGIGRDFFRRLPDTFTGFVSDMERAVKLAADGRWGDAAKQFGMAYVHVPARFWGTTFDMGARLLQGSASAVLTAIGQEAPARGLTTEERDYLKAIYGDSIDYDVIRIKRGGPLTNALPDAHTVGNIVYMPDKYFDPTTGKLKPLGLKVLSHEVGHVWQNQNGGGDYIHNALFWQIAAIINGGEYGDAYNWREALRDGKSFEAMNAEEQAAVMRAIRVALLDGVITAADGGTPPYSAAEIAFLLDTAEKLKSGEGAG
jgi:hypothetical protein